MSRLLVLPTVSMALIIADLVTRHVMKRDLLMPRERRAFYLGVALFAFVLYVASCGYLPNIYRTGFLPVPLVITALGAIALAEWSLPLALWMLAGFVACDLHLLPSRNLIDYFIDPLTAFIAASWCLLHLARKRRRSNA